MGLPELWFAILAVLWTGFFVLEGFDLGVGMLHRWLGRDDIERRVVINTVGPVWDGNEVWLIVAGAGTFAAFPNWYATWFSAGYLALLLLLVALILRGLSFEWRGRSPVAAWRGWWSWALTGGSAFIPLLLGIALGDLLVGLPIDGNEEFTGTFWDLLTPYGICVGVTLSVLCLLHGSTYLALRTTGELRARSRRLARVLALPALALVAGAMVWTRGVSGAEGWRYVLLAVPVLAIAVATLLGRTDREGWSFTATAVGIGGVLAALFACLYPDVMVSSTDPAYNLTIASAASGEYALRVMSIVALVLFPVVLLYQGWSYYVFRARVRTPAAGELVDLH